jgi:TolB-like protein/Tfp pilus assembly protein PilF
MKHCPQCNRVEADETLKFCRADGVPLVSDTSFVDGEAATGQIGTGSAGTEIETSILPHKTDAHSIRTTSPTTVLPQSSAGNTRALNKRKKFLTVAAVSVVVVAIATGGYVVGRKLLTSGTNETIQSIAVLPFENTSGSADSEYISDGLAETIIYRLSQLSNLNVSPRSSVFRYKGQKIDAEKVGNELGVDTVMSGRLIQRGDNLTISVDLVDVRNKKTLWGEQFERKTSDLLSTQREIASAIADKLRVKLSGNESTGITKQYTSNNDAYQLYLHGRYFWNKRTAENLAKATELLKAATEKDPNFALAYAGLADCYAVSYYYVADRLSRDRIAIAKRYALKAIELDAELAEPHATLAFTTWLMDWDKVGAEREFLRAIELNPKYATAHHWYSRYLRGVGRLEEAFQEIKRAEEVDPLSLVIINNIAEIYIDRGDLQSAARECQRMIDLDPNFWPVHQTLGIVLTKQGRYAEALLEAQKSIELSKRGNASLALLGYVHAKLGQRSEVDLVIKELEKRYGDNSAEGRDVAIVYAGLGDKDRAFAWLEKAFADHSVFLPFLRLEPLMEPLRSDARWDELLRRVLGEVRVASLRARSTLRTGTQSRFGTQPSEHHYRLRHRRV